MTFHEHDECIHGLGPIAACVICNGRAEREAKLASTTMPVFITSRYDSTCPACDLAIHIGDNIAWFPDHSEPTVHVECYES